MWLASSAGCRASNVDVVDLEHLQHLPLDEVAKCAPGHDGDRHGLLDPLMKELAASMRATPPSRRMSAGTRSSAITRGRTGVLGDLRLLSLTTS